MQQAAGTTQGGLSNASYVATYDLSCPTSPYGSVHNVEKGPIGERIAAKILQSYRVGGGGGGGSDTVVTDGPHAISARVVSESASDTLFDGDGFFELEVQFAGGSAPFTMRATKNCTSCCGGSAPAGKPTDGHTLDFDASGGGAPGAVVWVNSTGAVVDRESGSVRFRIAMSQARDGVSLTYPLHAHTHI